MIRLALECEQILGTEDLILTKDSEILKSIRRGEWTEEQVRDYFKEKEQTLEILYRDSKLPHSPDEGKIKALLLNCLEAHFGSLDKVINIPGKHETALREIAEICHRSGIEF